VLTFVQKEMPKFRMKINKIIMRMKDNNLDDYDTEYVDIDMMLQMYLEEFRAAKRDNMVKLSKYYKTTMQEQLKENDSAMLTFANVTKINSDFRMAKAQKTPT